MTSAGSMSRASLPGAIACGGGFCSFRSAAVLGLVLGALIFCFTNLFRRRHLPSPAGRLPPQRTLHRTFGRAGVELRVLKILATVPTWGPSPWRTPSTAEVRLARSRAA